MDDQAVPVLPHADADLEQTTRILAERERLARRSALRKIAAAGLLLSPLRAVADVCAVIPPATAGPFPGDGTNGPNALTQTGILRNDIRSNFGPSGSAVAPGVPLKLTLQVVDANSGCTPLPGYAVYVWHCDAGGRYSMYSAGVGRDNFLRGVQVADASGNCTFTTVFPGCYPGRWPHVHFEVYSSGVLATSGRQSLRTSQLALPAAPCNQVYRRASAIYASSAANLAGLSLQRDGIFSDDARLQMATVSGDDSQGYAALLRVGVPARKA